jgi:hypothetical protein
MADTNKVTNFDDPYQVADFARREGAEGLMRLADYFETTGQPIPPTVKTALLTSRGPGVFPVSGIFSNKRPNTRAAAETVPETLRPTDTLTAQEPSPERIAEYNYIEKNPDAAITPKGVFNQKTRQRLGDSVQQILALRSTPPAAPSPNTTTPKALPASRPAIQRKAPSVTEQLGPVPSYTLEAAPDAGVNLYNRPPTNYDLSSGDVEKEAMAFDIKPQEMNNWLSEQRILAARDTAAERKMAARKLVSGELASPIPTATASVRTDAPEAVKETIAATTPERPAPPAGTKPEVGSGGDDEMSSLRKQLGLQQMFEALGSAGSGKNLYTDGGILADRMKQVEALRAKREERQEGLDIERSQNNQTLDLYKRLFPDKADSLEALRDLTGKGAVFKQGLDAWMKREELEKVKLPTAEARIGQMGAGEDLTRAKIPEVGLEGESKRRAREQAAALGWARLSAQSAAAAARAAKDVAASGVSRGEQKDVDGQLENIQKIVKAGGYTPMLAALQQADEAIASLGSPPTMSAQAKHALPGGDRFLSPKEKAYYTAVDKLKQMEQLAVSGKVVSEPERAEFVRQYGTSWYSNPKAAAAYIELLRSKTANQLNMDLASVRASPAGQKALSAYEQAGGVTPTHSIFKGAGAAARPAKPSAVPAGKTVLWNVAESKWKAIPNENADAAVASGKYER